MERKLLIRTYKKGDEEKILELWKVVHPEREYNRERWMRWWRWMYKDNPLGNTIIYLAQHDGRIVGHESRIFMKMKIGNEMIKASQAIDLLVHPDYRHQGIYLKLERSASDEAKQKGVHITIAFPNEAAYPAHIKLGWFDVSKMQIMIKPLNWGNTIRLRIKNRFLSGFLAAAAILAFDKIFYRVKRISVTPDLAITQISFFDESIDELWSKVSSQYPIMVVRDRDYLNWRFVAIPDIDYSIYVAKKAGQICGYLVLRCMQREQIKVGIIFDILAQSEEIAQCLVSEAIGHCKRKKTDLIYYRVIANKTYINAFRHNGFISVRFIKGGRFCAHSSAPHISKRFLSDSENWLVQLGDSDMV